MAFSASEWLSHYPSGELCVVSDGDWEAFLDWIMTSLQRPLIVFAGQSDYAETAARLAPDAGRLVLIRPSRGIEKDLAEFMERPVERHPVFTAGAVDQFFSERLGGLGQNLRMLTGYDHPARLLARIVADRSGKILEGYLSEQLPSIIVHDTGDWTGNLGAAGTRLTFAVEPAATGDGEGSQPSAQAVQKHIGFLARTEPDVLEDMHGFLRQWPNAALFDYWRDQMMRKDVASGDNVMLSTFRSVALERLKHLRNILSERA